jgi:hypothetical protein
MPRPKLDLKCDKKHARYGLSIAILTEGLKIVDDILGSVHRDRMSAEAIGVTLFAFGRYVDEVFVRHFGSRWCREEDTEMRGLFGFLIVSYCSRATEQEGLQSDW